ncbi:MAG: response regulator [Candidatus Omnitrophota bacterium]|nr:response regulator [Candidatus Omnitrophota bacterium]
MSEPVKRILFVDDERTICKIMVSRLKKSNFDVMAVESGAEMLEKAKDVKPDLVILDHLMPGMTGLEACHKLKMNQETKEIPVIMFTGHHKVAFEEECLNAGAVGVIYKPDVGGLLQLAKDVFAGREVDPAVEEEDL